jgi:predicted nucleic acid-binding protein
VIVADANVIAYLLIEGRKSEVARQLHAMDSDWRMPPLWRAEFLNILAMQVQHGGASIEAAERTWQSARSLFSTNETAVDEMAALRISARFRISAYDAQYIALAQQLGVSCVSEDRELVRKFPDAVVTISGVLQG